MQPCIGRWHTHYRVTGGGTHAVARLESIRARAAEAYAEALQTSFGDDPAVYVLRSVRTELTLVNPAAGDAALARRWAAETCKAVVRAVTRHADDPRAVMRFDDSVDYVAHFIRDLIDGVAWGRWYYGAFAQYRRMTVEETLRRILIEYRDALPALFRRLALDGTARAVIARIAPDAGEVWRSAIAKEDDAADAAQWRVFVQTAIRVAGALKIWIGMPLAGDELWSRFASSLPLPPDWTQRRSLAASVFAVLDFAWRAGIMRVPAGPASDVRDAVAPFDWLDRDWLADAVASARRDDDLTTGAARPAALTPLQRRIVDRLREIVAAGALSFDGGTAYDRDAVAMALFAAMAAADPALAAERSAPAAIDWLLRKAEREWPLDGTPQRILGAIEIVLQQRVDRRPPTDVIESSFAGIFLLSRAILDARLLPIASALGIPGGALLLALAKEWTDDAADAGIVLWSGAVDAGEALDPQRCAALRDTIEQLMRQRAAFAPSLDASVDPEMSPLAAVASYLLRLWSQWLPGLRQSTAPWLVEQFIRRRGTAVVHARSVTVKLAPAPFDVLLDMAGYLAPIEEVPWLGGRRITFEIDRSVR